MSDKKHIDRLFQEKLKDFEATPNDAIWESIEHKLHQKKRKRRVIPLWWQMAGVAAILALMFTVGNLMFNDSNEINSTKNPVVNTNDKVNPTQPSSETNSISNNGKDENVVTNSESEENLNSDSTVTYNLNPSENSSVAIANTKTTVEKSKESQKTNSINQTLKNSNNNDTMASNTKIDDALNSSNLPEPDRNKIDNAQEKTKSDALISDTKNDIKTAVTDYNSEDEILELKEDSKKESQSIEDAITEVNNIDEKEKDETLSKWNISTSVAPVYFSSLGNGSSLDEQFVGTSKSSEINLSYGINGSYVINKKLKIRSGINKVNLGYNINEVDIRVGNGLNLSALSKSDKNINLNDYTQNASIVSTSNLSYEIIPEILASNYTVSLNQELGFIELPIEIEYSILNKKLGLNVIGGFSTLFLENNKVYSTLNSEKTYLGEAQNINDTSYSANFGLGLNYNVSEKIKLNLEPTFKYQINTFQDTSGDFRPYFIGIYTGLSYKF